MLLATLTLAPDALAKDGPRPGHLCPAKSSVVFDCRLEDGGRFSICGSEDLAEAQGWVQAFLRDVDTVSMWDPNPRDTSRTFFTYKRESSYQRRMATLIFTFNDQLRTFTLNDDDSGFPKVHRATLTTQSGDEAYTQVCARPWYGDLAPLEGVVPTTIEAQ